MLQLHQSLLCSVLNADASIVPSALQPKTNDHPISWLQKSFENSLRLGVCFCVCVRVLYLCSCTTATTTTTTSNNNNNNLHTSCTHYALHTLTNLANKEGGRWIRLCRLNSEHMFATSATLQNKRATCKRNRQFPSNASQSSTPTISPNLFLRGGRSLAAATDRLGLANQASCQHEY